jgi:hypothetical protein
MATVAQITKTSEDQLAGIPDFGEGCMADLRDAPDRHGVTWLGKGHGVHEAAEAWVDEHLPSIRSAVIQAFMAVHGPGGPPGPERPRACMVVAGRR